MEKNIQENINNVATDSNFNDAVVRHLVDYKNKGVFQTSIPLSVTFKDGEKNCYSKPSRWKYTWPGKFKSNKWKKEKTIWKS